VLQVGQLPRIIARCTVNKTLNRTKQMATKPTHTHTHTENSIVTFTPISPKRALPFNFLYKYDVNLICYFSFLI